MDSQPQIVPPQAGSNARPVTRAHRVNAPAQETGSSLGIGDVYYVLFRHKWKILICSILGIAAAVGYLTTVSPPYWSDAKLFLRYVVAENRVVDPTGEAAQVKSPDMRGETILQSEVQILTSLDLAKQVASAIGPERILAQIDGSRDPLAAAVVVNRGLTVDVPRGTSVIVLRFEHPDPEIVQPVLNEIVQRYLQTHVSIHRAVGIIGSFLAQETDQLRARLAQTEEELRKVRNRAGIVSLTDAKKEYAEKMARLRDDILAAQAELAERTAVLNAFRKPAPVSEPTTESEKPPGIEEPPQAKVNEYRWVIARIERLRQREAELLAQFTPENSRVVDARRQLADAEADRRALEVEFPSLADSAPVELAQSGAGGGIDIPTEAARISAVEAKIQVLNAQLEQVKKDAATLDEMEGGISELLRRRELEEANYRYYAARLEQARINEALGTGKVSNISQIEAPTPPQRNYRDSLKIAAALVGGMLALGLGSAFAIEMFFDRSVRRPGDVERSLGLPLFLTVPAIKRRVRKAAALPLPPSPSAENADDASPPLPDRRILSPVADNGTSDGLRTYHETLRDRLIGYFESRDLTHKPKLVAVTGLDRGSGVTTIAAGLASSLSETGEGNVLLVDMTAGQGSAQQFRRGREVTGLEQVLDSREEAQVNENLYVVTEEPSEDRISRILPRRFNQLVPKLKASNFDYIIFDMPPVSQISITPRLAGFMDMVLLVLESEKTSRDLVQRATALLAESKPHVGTILNKHRPYVPKMLHQEELGNL